MVALILLCFLVGAVSAADDIGQDAMAIDDVAIAEQAGDVDLQTNEENVDVSTEQAISTDSQQDTSIGANDAEDENLRTSGTATVTNWTQLADKANSTGIDYTINLNGPIEITDENVVFGNNAIIEGNDNSYIFGNASGRIPFKSTTNSLSITFKNVKFQNIDCLMLIQLQTSGISKIENCTFINITTGDDHHSVLYNTWGTMNVTGCNFTNCTTGFGVITNYNWMSQTGVILNVKDSKFENNYALNEPGAINNCAIATVYNCTFNKNNSTMWAGAIHTHTKADTLIVGSTFTDNIAKNNGVIGWNGGALFSYSKLVVINSTFTDNKCNVTTGGGAIYGYSYSGSTYNITVDSCNFTHNVNYADEGRAGAIGVQNIGYLTVRNSNFINNVADYGQAIYAMTKDEPYCLNCTNCSCPNCPNCTNCTQHNVSTGDPNATLINNNYLNHTGDGDTVVINGEHYTFNYNIFVNSTQDKHYRGIDNQYDQEDFPDSLSPSIRSHSLLGSSILRDWEYHDVIYVNRSSPNDSENDENIHGSSWEDAYGQSYGLAQAINYINNDGIIYVAEGVYTQFSNGAGVNCTIIGMNRENTIFNKTFKGYDSEQTPLNWNSNKHPITTYINITFVNPKVNLRGAKVFINCTFVGAPILVNEAIYKAYNQHDYSWDDRGIDRGFDFYFYDCEFKNYDTTGTILEAFTTSQINFINCTFDNITANSIAKHTGDFIFEDAINFNECTFNNVNVKGIVDVAEGTAFGQLYSIEGCTGVESYGVVTEDGRDYINSTAKTETVISAEDLSVEVNADANLTATLKDIDNNPLAGKEIIVLVSGESSTVTTNDDGVVVIPVKYATAGEYEYTLYFAGDETTYKEITKVVKVTVTKAAEPDNGTNGSNSTPVTPTKTATKLTASKVTATYNVAKKLVITLKDANGKALANKKVTVKVGSISKTLKTNNKGQVSLNVATLVPKTYTATVKFAGDSSYKASSVKPKVVVNKAKPKLAAKAKTFKAKVKTKKFTATLKNNKGKVMKNTKLTLKVGKKTFTAKTNKKGVATFKITKLSKAKKYTATIKFAGNKYFKAISKKVKITIKK